MIQMRQQRLDFVCGQESGLPADEDYMRWDTGEMFIYCGVRRVKRADGTWPKTRSKAGNCFILSKEIADAFVAGGRKMRRVGPRLSTLQFAMQKVEVVIVNVHFPDSDRRKRLEHEAMCGRVDDILQKVSRDVVLTWMGDFNASLGVATDASDSVCGTHGNTHRNAAGTTIRNMAARYDMVDLVSHYPQEVGGTWVHMRSKNFHLIDRVFVRQQDKRRVQECRIEGMLTDSDHYTVRVCLSVERPRPLPKTTRQNRRRLGYSKRLQAQHLRNNRRRRYEESWMDTRRRMGGTLTPT